MGKAKAQEKLWSECSREEKAEVKEIEKSIRVLKEDYEKKRLSKRQYSQRKRRLNEWIDEVWEKYK